ncbi:hypothetical protein NPIL_97171 [Nephila pilipes]|uniref:Uncharacterized protein n=1 Tax=Nephila pilipes TaxID=299642 RepID=A0A8X6NM35_NEPPI|nr:hypothetical protein NPIL_97171 [Nephila pilipes]
MGRRGCSLGRKKVHWQRLWLLRLVLLHHRRGKRTADKKSMVADRTNAAARNYFTNRQVLLYGVSSLGITLQRMSMKIQGLPLFLTNCLLGREKESLSLSLATFDDQDLITKDPPYSWITFPNDSFNIACKNGLPGHYGRSLGNNEVQSFT